MNRDILGQLREAVLSGKQDLALKITGTGLTEGVSATALVERGLYPAACEIARSFGHNEMCMAEVLAKSELIQLLLLSLPIK